MNRPQRGGEPCPFKAGRRSVMNISSLIVTLTVLAIAYPPPDLIAHTAPCSD
jgi:Ca2+/Na+ antiporter